MSIKIQNLLLGLILTFSLSSVAQTLDELEKEKNRLNIRIENANKLLLSYSKKKQSNINSVRLLDNQIKDRESLIAVYHSEIDVLKADINILESEIDNNEKELSSLKEQYTKLINEAYLNKKKYNELSFFFGAESFNEAYRRYAMLKEYNKFRHNQGVLIQNKAIKLDESYKLLNTNLKVQNNALNSVQQQYAQLINDKQKVNKNIQELKQKETSLKQDIRKQKKSLKKLEDEIVKLIEEISNETVEPSDFHLSKGKLIWPVRDGVVISRFGEHPHPVLKYVKVNNNGLDLQASEDKKVRPVFAGKVSRIVPIPGYNKAILIRHGRFLTVYANIGEVNVKPGQNVTKSSILGTIYSGKGENSGVLHFEIWEESVKLNPEHWLKK
ncbi:murein hydrolase activator EnvC family protein [Carboxylicivirga marina]|uniref:Peptidoglycan DD-metalloendopeptidase family protein n=1 Tax=Carboxylicivirga marina TaxID=2800988 RepID=A0ABS1HG36_9BACT|nr:peptidoglycan DD-metalloendopeptidase family protein [Carboxylicivirga marina]MBK3516599.1 peptidoglycan DD-metalloendopeptidase family protein [Carboxylicivirga marina]